MKQIILFTSLIISCLATHAQNNKIKLFIDCSQVFCDYDFIRREIPVADFVRDRQLSDIHILISSQQAGNGGQRFELLFLGQNNFSQLHDTLNYFSQGGSTQDESRRQMLKVIQAGIISCVAKSGQLESVNFSYNTDSSASSKSALTDPWNNWVFNIGGRAQFSGDKNYREKYLAANASASRVTEKTKLSFSFYKSNSSNAYQVDDIEKNWLKTRSAYMEFEENFVKTISPKWSWALQSAFSTSTYDNIRSSLTAAAGIEYNIYPYKNSGNKFFALRYMFNAVHRKYFEETIFDKSKEMLFANELGAYAYFTQPWGSISSQVTYYAYMHDMSKNNVAMDANLELKLFKGVSINFFGNASIIHDQLSLPKAGASSQDVLLRLKALSTSFNYYTGIGINYRFGSSLNNFVNPRFTNRRW